MVSVTFSIPDETKFKMQKLGWINWSELVRKEILLKHFLKRFNSKEEQDLIKWSVELGRKAKKDSFKRLLTELTPKERKEISE